MSRFGDADTESALKDSSNPRKSTTGRSSSRGSTAFEPEKASSLQHVSRQPHTQSQHPIDGDFSNDDKIEITEADCVGQLGYGFSSFRKWSIIAVIFVVQISMNFNASLYSNAVHGISEDFNISSQAARCGAMIFLVAYAFGYVIALLQLFHENCFDTDQYPDASCLHHGPKSSAVNQFSNSVCVSSIFFNCPLLLHQTSGQ